MPEPRPVITMDTSDESLWLENPARPGRPVYLGFLSADEFHPRTAGPYSIPELRALADWLDQYEAAGILAQVGDQ